MEKLEFLLAFTFLAFGGFVRCVLNIARPPKSRRRRAEILYALLFLFATLIGLAMVVTNEFQ